MSTSLVDGKAGSTIDNGSRTRAPPKYSISRDEDDTLQWDPPIGSRELANALSYHYPMVNGLQEKMQSAMLDFFEAENGTSALFSHESKKQLDSPGNSKAPDSASHTGDGSTESQKPPKQSVILSKKGDGQEMRGIWDVRTGESVKFSWRTRPLSPERRKATAANRGNICEHHKKSKTRCDPTRCKDNKLYPGKSISPTPAEGQSNRKRDREDGSPRDGSQAVIGSPSTVQSNEDGSSKSAKASSSLSPSSSQSATQSGDRSTPSDRDDYYDPGSYPPFEGESGLMSLVSYPEDSNPSKRMKIDNVQNLSKDLLSNGLDAPIIFDYVPGNETQFPWAAVVGPSLGTMGQYPFDFQPQKDWPSAPQSFGGVNDHWIEALMASDMPPLDFSWSDNAHGELFSGPITDGTFEASDYRNMRGQSIMFEHQTEKLEDDPQSKMDGVYGAINLASLDNASLEYHIDETFWDRKTVDGEPHMSQQAAAHAWSNELSSEPQLAYSIPEKSLFHRSSSGNELSNFVTRSSSMDVGMEDMFDIGQLPDVPNSFKPPETTLETYAMPIEVPSKKMAPRRREVSDPFLPSSSMETWPGSQPQGIIQLQKLLPSAPIRRAEAAWARTDEMEARSQEQELSVGSFSSTPRPDVATFALASAALAPGSAPTPSIGAMELLVDEKKPPEMPIASAVNELDALKTGKTGRSRSLTSPKRTYIQELSILLQESGIMIGELLQQYPPTLYQEDAVSVIDIIIFGVPETILGPIMAPLRFQFEFGYVFPSVRILHSVTPVTIPFSKVEEDEVETILHDPSTRSLLHGYISSFIFRVQLLDNPNSQILTILITPSSDGILVKRGMVARTPISKYSEEQSDFSYKMDWLDREWSKLEDIFHKQQISARHQQQPMGLSLPAPMYLPDSGQPSSNQLPQSAHTYNERIPLIRSLTRGSPPGREAMEREERARVEVEQKQLLERERMERAKERAPAASVAGERQGKEHKDSIGTQPAGPRISDKSQISEGLSGNITVEVRGQDNSLRGRGTGGSAIGGGEAVTSVSWRAKPAARQGLLRSRRTSPEPSTSVPPMPSQPQPQVLEGSIANANVFEEGNSEDYFENEEFKEADEDVEQVQNDIAWEDAIVDEVPLGEPSKDVVAAPVAPAEADQSMNNEIIQTKRRANRADYSLDDERSSSSRRPRGYSHVPIHATTDFLTSAVAKIDDDRRSTRSERLDIGTSDRPPEVDRPVERVNQIQRRSSDFKYSDVEEISFVEKSSHRKHSTLTQFISKRSGFLSQKGMALDKKAKQNIIPIPEPQLPNMALPEAAMGTPASMVGPPSLFPQVLALFGASRAVKTSLHIEQDEGGEDIRKITSLARATSAAPGYFRPAGDDEPAKQEVAQEIPLEEPVSDEQLAQETPIEQPVSDEQLAEDMAFQEFIIKGGEALCGGYDDEGIMTAASTSQFRPSTYQYKEDWGDTPAGGFQTSAFMNSHHNVSHYNNPSFQPEQWTPDCDEAVGKLELDSMHSLKTSKVQPAERSEEISMPEKMPIQERPEALVEQPATLDKAIHHARHFIRAHLMRLRKSKNVTYIWKAVEQSEEMSMPKVKPIEAMPPAPEERPATLVEVVHHAHRSNKTDSVLLKPVKSLKSLNPVRPITSMVTLLKKMVGMKL